MPRLFIAKRSWTTEEDDLLRSLTASGKHGYRDMVPFFPGRTQASIICRANQKLKIVNTCEYRKWEYNDTYFHTPTLTSAYIAGFLAADGCVHVRAKNLGCCLILELANEDINQLNWIKDTIGYKGPTILRNTGRSSYFKISISEQYKTDLEINFGVIPQKTHRLCPPAHLAWEQQFAYLLGLLDGDGCIHLSKENKLSINLINCAKKSLDWMKTFVDAMDLPMLRRIGRENRVTPHCLCNAYVLHYTGARAVCLVQLAQEFAVRHNLPILARKWNNPRLNQYISAFYAKHTAFRFDPKERLDQLTSPTQQNPPAL